MTYHLPHRSVLSLAVAVSTLASTSLAFAEETKDTTKDEAAQEEAPGTKTHSLGFRARALTIPKYVIGMFADGGASVDGYQFGLEYGTKKRNFETIVALSYTTYGMDAVPFKGKSDPDTGWEKVDVNLSVVYATVDFLWSTDLSPKWSILYGGSGGLGIVFGTFHRHQLTPTAGSTAGDPSTYVPCVPTNGDGTQYVGPTNVYCGNDNDHYGRDEPTWLSGGSKPFVMPWLALQTGVRFQASDQFALRLDAGLGVTGFFLGLGGQYGLL